MTDKRNDIEVASAFGEDGKHALNTHEQASGNKTGVDVSQQVGSNAGSIVNVNLPSTPASVQPNEERVSEPEHVQTIRLINEWMGKLTRRLDEQAATHERDYRELKGEIGELRRVIEGMNTAVVQAVRVPPNHMALFTIAMALLFVPVVTYYHDFKMLYEIEWQVAYTIAALCYFVSAMLWWYLFFGGRQ
jgi:hypothetical protein